MSWKKELKIFLIIAGVFIVFYFLPVGKSGFENSVMEALYLAQMYAREHVVLCLIPAFFIAGAISVFISKGAVMKYLGAGAKKTIAYPIASVSGSVLAVCSCTILPLFAGIHKRGAGIGPATAFLYSGPAINVLAVILTARVLGVEMGIARTLGAVVFSVVIGLIMQVLFPSPQKQESTDQDMMDTEEADKTLGKIGIYFALMVMILVFSNWGRPEQNQGIWHLIYSGKWIITSVSAVLFGVVLMRWYQYSARKIFVVMAVTAVLAVLFHTPVIPFLAGFAGIAWASVTDGEQGKEWMRSTWDFAKQIFPLLFAGILMAGFLLGRPETEGIIPSKWISSLVGGNSILSNFFASVTGAFMYFATLTEVPILQGLIANGMGKGPALALLLAGPAVSLPNMLVIRSVMGTKKTMVFLVLVVIMATLSGMIFGYFF
ncbi:MAG: hypothetical protein GF421_10955 [Candidatus Aminicenantes bacterium]|nr:hypothetical protein [Candidatus Aminicenantes bacterium]